MVRFNGLSYNETHEIRVLAGTQLCGTIKLISGMGVPAQYTYFPKGSNRHGEVFSSVEACKRSLENPQ